MSDLPPPQFRRTKSGQWAVMGPVATLEAALDSGGLVEVQKKSGDWSKFTVASLGRAFDVDGVEMCYGYAPDDEAEPGQARPAGGGARKAAPPRGAQQTSTPPAPPRDDSEPLPEYQGGPEDEWQPDDGQF